MNTLNPAKTQGTGFNPVNRSVVYTPDTNAAACLSALGFPFLKEQPLHVEETPEGDRIAFFFFEETAPSEKMSATEALAAFQSEDWNKQNPDHKIAYIRAALLNRRELLNVISTAKPVVRLQLPGDNNGKTKPTYIVFKDSKRYEKIVANGGVRV